MKKLKTYIGLTNPKSPENVASVMRAAGNYRVDAVFYTGERYPRAVRLNPAINNLSRKVGSDIPLSAVSQFSADLSEMKIICVELVENALSLPDFQHPDNAYYIFGPEDGTISQAVIDKADAVVYVPTNGCMNLAATVNVVLYDRLSKSGESFESRAFVSENRDTNNNVKVKL